MQAGSEYHSEYQEDGPRGESGPSRRAVIRGGAGLLAVPAVMSVATALAQGTGQAGTGEGRAHGTSESGNTTPAVDSRSVYPKPEFPDQSQPFPGLARDMNPKPDHGEKSYRGSGQLAGRRALITGGDSGIGRAVAIAFAREGADVVINHLPAEQPDADEVVQLIREAGRQGFSMPGDLREEQFCTRLIADAVGRLGGLDVLVLNAGRQQARNSIEELTTEEFDATFKTNVYAPFWLTKAALQHLKPGSAIVITASEQGYQPASQLFHYAQTKSCNVSFAKSLAKQFAARGIRVNAVAPGPFWTPLQVAGGQLPGKVTKFGAETPLGRPGQPAEIAPAYVMLAAPGATYMTGQVVAVTGGQAPF